MNHSTWHVVLARFGPDTDRVRQAAEVETEPAGARSVSTGIRPTRRRFMTSTRSADVELTRSQ